jgi:transposase-like protein
VAILREADRDPIAVVAKRHGVSQQTIYTWRKRFGTFQANDVGRRRQLEAESGPCVTVPQGASEASTEGQYMVHPIRRVGCQPILRRDLR